MATPLSDTDAKLSKKARDILLKARASWLKNTEVLELLNNYRGYDLPVSHEPPSKPDGGTLYLFNRKVCRFFRKDGHDWRKKSDGKTVRETHEKLKVGNRDKLNCYYAHAQKAGTLQRRCYWLLEGEDHIVLVHYLNAMAAGNRARQGSAGRYDSMARAGSMPDSFGSMEPASWSITSAEGVALKRSLRSPKRSRDGYEGQSISDPQHVKLELPVELEASDLAVRAQQSSADNQISADSVPESSRDGCSTQTQRESEPYTGDTYPGFAEIDVESGLNAAPGFPNHGPTLSHASPFASAQTNILLGDLPSQQRTIPATAPVSISPFANTEPFGSNMSSPVESPSPSGALQMLHTDLDLLPHRSPLLSFARAASDGASLLHSHALQTPASPSSHTYAPIRRSSTARPPMPARQHAVDLPFSHPPSLSGLPMAEPLEDLNPEGMHSVFAPHSQPWSATADAPEFGDTFDELLQQCSDEPTLFSSGSLLGTSRMPDMGRAASVPGPLTGIDRTDMLDEAFSFGPYQPAPVSEYNAGAPQRTAAMLRQCSDSLALGGPICTSRPAAPATMLPSRSSVTGRGGHDSSFGEGSARGDTRRVSFSTVKQENEPDFRQMLTRASSFDGRQAKRVAIDVLQPNVKGRPVARNITVTFSQAPEASLAAFREAVPSHTGSSHHLQPGMMPASGDLMSDDVFDGAVFDLLSEAQANAGMMHAQQAHGADRWPGFNPILSDPHIKQDEAMDIADAPALGLSLGSLSTWLGPGASNGDAQFRRPFHQ
ncbi:hypothetical protein WJX73_009573 [Symbiochloris irregularis]|uniref:CG-1 domain-containing protein n=1 Tax=Symbiochloris irregularis TaxID=706552 RepID=A0AAW1P8Q4_9CHLO